MELITKFVMLRNSRIWPCPLSGGYRTGPVRDVELVC